MKRLVAAIVMFMFALTLFVPAQVVFADECTVGADVCETDETASFERCIKSCNESASPEDMQPCKTVCNDQNAEGLLACDTLYAMCKARISAGSGGDAVPPGKIVSVINPLGITSPQLIIGNLISAILSIVGSVTLLMFVYGGVLWITSMGNDKTVAKGKAVLVWATIGLVVIAGAYTLTNAVITGLTTGQVIGA